MHDRLLSISLHSKTCDQTDNRNWNHQLQSNEASSHLPFDQCVRNNVCHTIPDRLLRNDQSLFDLFQFHREKLQTLWMWIVWIVRINWFDIPRHEFLGEYVRDWCYWCNHYAQPPNSHGSCRIWLCPWHSEYYADQWCVRPRTYKLVCVNPTNRPMSRWRMLPATCDRSVPADAPNIRESVRTVELM